MKKIKSKNKKFLNSLFLYFKILDNVNNSLIRIMKKNKKLRFKIDELGWYDQKHILRIIYEFCF